MDFQVDGEQVHAATGSRPLERAEPAIILIHGAGMDRTVWQLQTRNIAYQGRQVYAVDLPGHGRSAGAALTSIEAMADWLDRFMAAAGLKTATVIGHSMGALVAIAFAARYPARMDNLCLMGIAETMPVHPDLLSAAKNNEALAADLIVFWGVGEKAQTGGHPHPGLWVQGASRTLLGLSRSDVLYVDLVACNAYAGVLAAAQKVQCPTRFILGRDDKMTPAARARSLGAAIGQSETTVIDSCGHMMMLECPNQVHAALVGIV
ncbi:MAG: alpha/beta hydrolase [Rhodospirillales bacterium]|nr:alpha/beta hydrolase [Rhodospirillales bacterium]